MKSLVNGKAGHSGGSAPLRQRFGFTIEGYKVVISFVVSLLRHGSPFAIARGITKAIVDPLKSKPLGWMPHITEKVIELVPTVTNRDAPSAVVKKHGIVGVVAPLNHFVPTSIDRCALHPVRSITFSGNFGVKTPARFSTAIRKIHIPCSFGVSTVAGADPKNVFGISCFRDSSQPAKSDTGSYFRRFHFSSPKKAPCKRSTAVRGESDVRFRWPSRAVPIVS